MTRYDFEDEARTGDQMHDERLQREAQERREYERDMEDREYERRAAETRQEREYDEWLEDQYNTALEVEHNRELLMGCCP